MQKIVKILEKNVEWLALALGGLFLLWMVYQYAFLKPVTTTVGASKLAPGEVDTRTADGPAKALSAAMAESAKDLPNMPEPDFVNDLKKRLDPPMDQVAMATPWSGEPLPASEMKGPAPQIQLPSAVVTALPAVPAPDSMQFSQGRSNVNIPPPQVAGTTAAPAGAGQGTPADKNWVTVAGIIHTKPIADAFSKAKIPAQLSSTLVLRVELVREEQQDDGTWGPEQVVPPLSNMSLLPMPGSGPADKPSQGPYKEWAEKDQKDLLQPDFYQVLQADQWLMPGVPPPVPVEAPFDPSAVTDPSTLTPDQRKQYEDYEAKKDQDARDKLRGQQQQPRNQAPPQYPPVPGGGRAGGGYRGAAEDAQRPMTLAQAIAPAAPGIQTAPPMMGQPGAPGDATAGNNINPAMNNPSATLPAGSFDPTQQQDIVVWAHDDTVQPGKTYRYKLRYYIKNPVWQTVNVCNPQNLADQFYIASTDNKVWTDAINVKSETNFFVVAVSPSVRPVVKFDIFRWKNGAWQMQTAEAGPGDMIGNVDATTQTDFTTGLTLVTVVPDPSNPKTILLTTENGQILRRDLGADQNSSEHKKLKEQAQAALAPKTAAAP
jgi:hypothetical protein